MKRSDDDAFQASTQDILLAHLGEHPDKCLEASIMADSRRPKGICTVRHRLALVMGSQEPMLNATKKTVEKDLRDHSFDGSGKTHAKDKLFKIVMVKPETIPASRISGSWATQVWNVYTLKYSPGLVLVNHKGEETNIFPGWGKLRKALESQGFRIIR